MGSVVMEAAAAAHTAREELPSSDTAGLKIVVSHSVAEMVVDRSAAPRTTVERKAGEQHAEPSKDAMAEWSSIAK